MLSLNSYIVLEFQSIRPNCLNKPSLSAFREFIAQ